MKILWELLLKLSSTAAAKLYKSEVIQVDIHLANGQKLMIMSKDESERLARCTKLMVYWTPEQVDEITKQIDKINSEVNHGESTQCSPRP